jgi:NADH-quinone oxidoreductase subunit L
MDHYGGLRKKLPFTFTVMLIGCLAIAGIWPFAGFFSKDAILAATWENGLPLFYIIGLITSLLTAFYMFRMLFLTFFGAPRDHHTYDHAHEGPWTMMLPLGILAFGTLVVGFLGQPLVWGGSSFSHWLEPALPKVAHHAVEASLEYTLMSAALVAGGIGILIAWVKYGSHAKTIFGGRKNPFWRLMAAKYYFDEAYDNLIVKPTIGLSRWGLWRTVDDKIIDGFVNGVPRFYAGVSHTVRYIQTGAARVYAYAMLFGALAILLIVFARYGFLRF